MTRNRLAAYKAQGDWALPPPIRSEHACRSCILLPTCALAHAALEAGNALSFGLPDHFTAMTQHLTPIDLAFLRHWLGLLELEQLEGKAAVADVWAVSPPPAIAPAATCGAGPRFSLAACVLGAPGAAVVACAGGEATVATIAAQSRSVLPCTDQAAVGSLLEEGPGDGRTHPLAGRCIGHLLFKRYDGLSDSYPLYPHLYVFHQAGVCSARDAVDAGLQTTTGCGALTAWRQGCGGVQGLDGARGAAYADMFGGEGRLGWKHAVGAGHVASGGGRSVCTPAGEGTPSGEGRGGAAALAGSRGTESVGEGEPWDLREQGFCAGDAGVLSIQEGHAAVNRARVVSVAADSLTIATRTRMPALERLSSPSFPLTSPRGLAPSKPPVPLWRLDKVESDVTKQCATAGLLELMSGRSALFARLRGLIVHLKPPQREARDTYKQEVAAEEDCFDAMAAAECVPCPVPCSLRPGLTVCAPWP
jgi:hypothetical protein